MKTKYLPYVELHCHLDGSLRPETIIDIAKEESIKIPSFNINEIKRQVSAPLNCKSLDEYLQRFDIPNMVMQSKKSLRRITFELFEDAAKENVKYMEVRFAPWLHVEKGLKLKEVIESVINGMNEAEKKYDIKGNIILCCMRNMSASKAMDVINAGKEFLGKGVVAVDLAGPELKDFSKIYKDAFALARSYGYRVTVHAGENGIGKNVLDAIEILGAERIGHGIFIKDCVEAYNLVKEKYVTLELCLTSNVQTKAVDRLDKHPAYKFFKDNILISLSTDNRTVSNTSLNKEYKLLMDNLNFSIDDLIKINEYSIMNSFADYDTKLYILNKIKNYRKD